MKTEPYRRMRIGISSTRNSLLGREQNLTHQFIYVLTPLIRAALQHNSSNRMLLRIQSWAPAFMTHNDANIYKQPSPVYPEVKPMGRGRPTKCPYCKSVKSVSKGFKYRAHGKAKDRKCGNCGKRYLVEVPTRTVRTCPDFACQGAG